MTMPNKTRSAAAPPDGPALAAFYGRVSTGKQDSSITDQDDRAEVYCASRPRPLVLDDGLRFTDSATSGGIPIDERPGGASLIAMLAGRTDVKHLVVTKLDRIGRDLLDGEKTLRWLDEHGVTLHILDLGGESISTAGPVGRLILQIVFAVAQWDRANIRNNIRTAMKQKLGRGEFTGGKPPYGCVARPTGRFKQRGDAQVEILELAEHPEEHAWLLRMLAWEAMDWGCQRIATALNREGCPPRTPGGVGIRMQFRAGPELRETTGEWRSGNVATILANSHTAKVRAQASEPVSQ